MTKASKKRIAVFPGSFDPLTLGHLDIIERAARLVDQLYVSVGYNQQKSGLLNPDDRMRLIQKCTQHLKNVEATTYTGLTVQHATDLGASFLIRSIRNESDWTLESQMAAGHQVFGMETIFLFTTPSLSHISSTLVREIYRFQGDISAFVPKKVLEFLKKHPA